MNLSRRKLLIGAGIGAGAVAAGAAITPMLQREGVLMESKSRSLPVDSTPGELPKSADVVIIGGGIQGVCTALCLAERGMEVVICEKGVIAGEQSGRAYSQIICWELDDRVLPLVLRSKQLWKGMNERINADTSWRIQPRVQTYTSEEGMLKAREWARKAKQAFPDPELLNVRFIEGNELQQRIPGARTPWQMAGLEENAASVDPEIGAPMIARYLQSKGVKIYTQCAVRGIETEAGKVSGVVTERGAIRAKTVVLAGGAWSRLFLGNYGLQLRTMPVYLSQQRLSAVSGAPKGNGAIGTGVYWRLQADGTYANAPRLFTAPIIRESFTIGADFLPQVMNSTSVLPMYYSLNRDFIRSFTEPTHWAMDEISPFERVRIGAPNPSHEFCDLALARLRAEFPVFNDSRVIERWGGRMDIAADHSPVISPVDQYPGLIINTAHSWGMTQGPASGELVADIIQGVKPRIDPSNFAFSRFQA
ncbi:NAD(P)/FAD-dependent oxidoreductase [Pseudomonas putida]|uniref:NAD(P)/FAD-dependent oxidoreductase n=1 Tax=Pseudomonas putida TaxID=303 RepID=UPI000D355970|nr:FAD-binding oxidoreductase [Pseudomonas putida]PTV51793.1 FAD-dependent oxidoreductase [Pseudomonas putida]